MTDTPEQNVNVEQQIPRHQPSNPYNYTNCELAVRKSTLKAMERDYPKLPYGWLEMVYDFCKNTPQEEVDKIINEGLWEGPGKFTSDASSAAHTLNELNSLSHKTEIKM